MFDLLEEEIAELFEEAARLGTVDHSLDLRTVIGPHAKSWAWRPPRRLAGRTIVPPRPLEIPSRVFSFLHKADWLPWNPQRPRSTAKNRQRLQRIDAELRAKRPHLVVVPANLFAQIPVKAPAKPIPVDWGLIGRVANLVCSPTPRKTDAQSTRLPTAPPGDPRPLRPGARGKR